MPVQDYIRLRRGTAAAWTSVNPILSIGELGYETDTLYHKMGDGVTHWADLEYCGSAIDLTPEQIALIAAEIDLPVTTAQDDVIVGAGSPSVGTWIKKTLAEFKTILGLGTAAYTASTDYCADDDSRLSDSRTPTSHGNTAHTSTFITSLLSTEVVQAATDTLSASECYGTIINNYGQSAANTQTLPAAAAGLSFMAIVGTSGMGALHFKANTGDKIYLDGTALDDADKVSCATPAVGNCAAFFCFQTGSGAYDWYCNSIQGTWTDGGA